MKKILWIVIGLPVMFVAWFLVSFQTLSPCTAYRNEVQKQTTEKAGVLGKAAGAIGGAAAEIQSADWTPTECAYRVIKLKLKGALDD